jgi:hypothetical protein
MDKVKPEKIKGLKVYLTEADLASQLLHRITQEELLLKLKAWLLFSDNIIIAGSHILSSPLTFEILKKYPVLLERGIILPYLRDQCKDFEEYLKLKLQEKDPTFLIQKKGKLKEAANLLNEKSKRVVLWAPSSAIESYRQSIIKELSDPQSLVRSKLVGIRKTDILDLIKNLEKASFISRGTVNNLARKYLGIKRNILIKHSDFLYYLWGAAHLDSEPVLNPNMYTWGRNKLSISIGKLLRSDEIPVLKETLSALGIARTILDILSFSDIIEMRDELVAKSFRSKWHDLITQAKKGSQGNSGKDKIGNESKILFELVKKELERERSKRKYFSKSKAILTIGSLVTSGITTFIANPILGVGALLLSLSSIDPLLEAIERRLGGTELIIFCTRLQKELFNNIKIAS